MKYRRKRILKLGKQAKRMRNNMKQILEFTIKKVEPSMNSQGQSLVRVWVKGDEMAVEENRSAGCVEEEDDAWASASALNG